MTMASPRLLCLERRITGQPRLPLGHVPTLFADTERRSPMSAPLPAARKRLNQRDAVGDSDGRGFSGVPSLGGTPGTQCP